MLRQDTSTDNHAKEKPSGTGASRRHIKGSNIEKGPQSAKFLVNWRTFDNCF